MRSAYAITHFCDDIRAEMGGKFSYMGIYGSDIVLSSPPPALLPKLAFAISAWIPSEQKVSFLRVVISREAAERSEEILSADLPIETPEEFEEGTYNVANVHLQAVPFQITSDCTLTVRVYLDGGEELKAGQIKIHHAPPPTAPVG